MRREVSCEGDRGKATRVASKYDAVCEVTDEHFAGAKLRLEVNRDGEWWLYAYTDEGMKVAAAGYMRMDGRVHVHGPTLPERNRAAEKVARID